MGITRYFQELAAKAKKLTNSEEAQRIKTKLITIGAILTIVGFVGAFACFASFAILGFQGVRHGEFNFGILIPFLLLIPCAGVGGIGTFILRLGIGIVVAKATTNFLDGNSYCPNCGDVIEEGELYCKKCGKPLLKEKICPNCHTQNDMDSTFCKNCGTKLE